MKSTGVFMKAMIVALMTAATAFGAATTKPAGLVDLTTSSAGSVSDSSATASGYAASKAFDGIKNQANSRWLASKADHMYLVYHFNAPTTVNAISLFTPGDTYGWNTTTRAPKAWTFSGSNDGDTWTTLDMQTNETGWPSTAQERFYRFANNTAYEYYKFDCTANNGASDYLQLVEMEFYNYAAPLLGACSVEVSGGDFVVSVKEDAYGADTVSLVADDGIAVTTNAFATFVSGGTTVTGLVSNLAAGKTYQLAVLAENAVGSDEVAVGTFYLGELALGATANASEATLTAGTVEVSRAGTDPFPLVVNYAISGNIGTQGVTWEAPTAVTIPAGESTAYLTVTPLVDVTVSEDVTATVSLAAGDYGIPAAPDHAKALLIENTDTPDGYAYDVLTITNAFDNPAGGFFSPAPASALNNSANRVINFARPEDAPEGLREFAHYAGNWVYVEANETTFARDWLMFPSMNAASGAITTNRVRCASEELTGLRARQDVRAYVGSWYVPEGGTYSFRMHMVYPGVFSLDGKLILRQATTAAVSTNGVELTAGWHNFYAAFVCSNNGTNSKIGPGSGESLGFSFSASNASLSAAEPGHAFETSDGYKFSTAFNAVLVPSIWATGGDVIIDCANALGDIRLMGQLASPSHKIKFANLPAGRALEIGCPINYSATGWQNLNSFAYVRWTDASVPPGVNVRFEGAVAIDNSWTSAGRGVWSDGDRSAYSLGKWVLLATEVPNFLGTYTDEFVLPDGMLFLQAMRPEVLGDTAKIRSSRYSGIGIGGAPISLTQNNVTGLPIKVQYASRQYKNDFEFGSNDVSLNGTLPWNGGDSILGNVTGGALRITGWGRRMSLYGSVNVNVAQVVQRGSRMFVRPTSGSAASSIATVSLGSEVPGATDEPYVGSTFGYFPETSGEHPLWIGTLDAGDAAFHESRTFGRRAGATVSTYSNNTVNVGTLKGKGVHLRTIPAFSATSWSATNDDVKETDHGFANFVFGQINGGNPMKVYVSTNVNITVTNIVKAAAFDYAVMASGVNAAVLDIEGTCAAGTTVKAADIAMLPARVKGFTGDITLTDETEGRTYPVTFDFDRGVPVGGCDGSGRLAAAPSSGHIALSFTGEPVKGTWGVLRFDDPNGKLDGWTISAPTRCGNFGVTVIKDQYGFSIRTGRLGLVIGIR